MEASWAAAAIAALGARFGAAGLRASLTLPAALLSLAGGYVVATLLLRRDEPEAAGPGQPGRRAGRAWLSLALGCGWALGAVWAVRHPGDDPRWLAALPPALAGAWGGATGDLAGLLIAFALWWRGQRIALDPPEHDSTVKAFGIGALALAAALLAGGAGAPALLALVLLFLAAGLPALSLARLQAVRRDLQTGTAHGSPARLDAVWWRTLLPPVLGVIALACAGLLLGEPGARAAAARLAAMAGEALLALAYWPLVMTGYFAEWLLLALQRLLGPPPRDPQPPELADPAGIFARLREAQAAAPPALPAWLPWLALSCAAVLVAGAFVASSRAVRRERSEPAAAVRDRESVGSWRRLWVDLVASCAAALERLLRRGQRALGALPVATRGSAPAQLATGARDAYRRLLALGRRHALPRRRHETPAEYFATWRATLPGGPEAGGLTNAYTQARYGPPALPPAPAGRLQALLRRLEAALTAAAGKGR
jgi:hypothetical protein